MPRSWIDSEWNSPDFRHSTGTMVSCAFTYSQLTENARENSEFGGGVKSSSQLRGTTYFIILYQYIMTISLGRYCPGNSGACGDGPVKLSAPKRLWHSQSTQIFG